jgi:hypothetical protein
LARGAQGVEINGCVATMTTAGPSANVALVSQFRHALVELAGMPM